MTVVIIKYFSTTGSSAPTAPPSAPGAPGAAQNYSE